MCSKRRPPGALACASLFAERLICRPEASYEATLLAAMSNAANGGTNKVLLKRVGEGAFGNDPQWLNAAILRALRLVQDHALDVRIVWYRSVPQDLRELVSEANR